MSLLNQVLLDLEKRNAETAPKQHLLSNLKTISPSQKKSYSLPLVLIFFTGIMLFIFYGLNEEENTTHLNNSPKKIKPLILPKKKLILKNTNNTVKISQPKAEKISTFIPPVQKPQAAEIKIKPAPVTKKPKNITIKTVSKTQQAEKLFRTAKLEKNEAEKQKKLELVLKLNPQHINARLLLSKTLLNVGLPRQTEDIVDQGLALFPQNLQFINLRSQLLLQNQQPQAALTMLQKVDAKHSQNETYLSLLASAYQQNNNNLKSLQSYQKLLTINPQKAEYWLGLAIALEKQGDSKQALSAYQHALDKNTLKNIIVSYIKQRISILK
jgi:tetratricopeptide (TPR) repeat protein